MDFKAALDKLVEQIVAIVNKMLEAAPFDKTYTGIVKSCTRASNTYVYTLEVEVGGKSRTINCAFAIPVNSIVKVLVPKNDWDLGRIEMSDDLFKPYYCEVYYNTSGGDVSFTGEIPFNTVIANHGNCYNTSTGRFTCPVNGVYAISFSYYSNGTAVTTRPAILKNGSMLVMQNGAYGHSLSTFAYATAGTTFSAGAYNASYPVNVYASAGHNRFTVTLVQRC